MKAYILYSPLVLNLSPLIRRKHMLLTIRPTCYMYSSSKCKPTNIGYNWRFKEYNSLFDYGFFILKSKVEFNLIIGFFSSNPELSSINKRIHLRLFSIFSVELHDILCKNNSWIAHHFTNKAIEEQKSSMRISRSPYFWLSLNNFD